MDKVRICYTLNGTAQEQFVDPRWSLAELIRQQHHLTGTKKGCEVGECGACTVLIDGKPFDSCIYLAIWAEGKEITTIEGLVGADGSLSDLQQAFVDEGAVQCGFCTPGVIVRAAAILNSGRRYSREELRRLISGNFCRCTGYENILNAIECAMERRLAEQEEHVL